MKPRASATIACGEAFCGFLATERAAFEALEFAEALLDAGAAAVERLFFLVAPDDREADVRSQCGRPAFSRVRELDLRYLAYSELQSHRETIARFGTGLKGVLAIARPVVHGAASALSPSAEQNPS